MRSPAEHHHQSFQSALIAWRYPGAGQPPGSPLALVPVLARWLGEYPELAEEVQRLAASSAAICQYSDDHQAVAELAEVGLDAGLVGAPTAVGSALASWLAIAGANAAMQLDDANRARVLLELAAGSLSPLSPADPIEPYLRMLRHLTAARVADAARELADAEEAFGVAGELAAALSAGRRAGELVTTWVAMMYGPQSSVLVAQAGEMVGRELRDAQREAVLGLARLSGDPERSREAIRWCVSDGFPLQDTALVLDGVLDALPADEVDVSADVLAEATGALDEPVRSNWLLAVRSQQAATWATRGDLRRAAQVLDVARAITPPTMDAVAMTMSVTAMNRLDQAAADQDRARLAADLLLSLVNATSGLLARSPLLLRLRAHTEPALAGAVRGELVAGRLAEADSRRRAAALIDAMRAPSDAGVPPRDASGPLAAAGDRLGRLAFALANRPTGESDPTLVVVIQNLGDEAVFCCVGADAGEPVAVTEPSAAAFHALQALVEGAERALRVATRPIEVETLGRAAFDALPALVRARILRARTVVVIPDLGGHHDRVPVELLHDGESFVGLTRVVARCLSLAHALRVFEPAVVRPPVSRQALCIAVPGAPGLTELAFAATEADGVRGTLATRGWDAVTLPAPEAEPPYVLELAPLADVLHVACHGDASAGAEALVLGDGARLRAIDIATRHRLRCVSYLNACSLGRGRYVGGGVSRGAAYAFAHAGSPAVIASLLPIEDRCAARLAEGFYRAAAEHPVGEALRLARAGLADEVDAVLWSSTILIGDPAHRLDGVAEVVDDQTSALLSGEDGPSDEQLVAARTWSDAHPEDLRLRAALGLVDLLADGSDPRAAAALAREIGDDVGEARALLSAADQHRQSGDRARLAEALGSAKDALEPLRGVWGPAYERHRVVAEELDALDPSFTPRTVETYRYDSGLTVNDRSDPAVDAILGMFEAQYEHEAYWRGEPRLANPDGDVEAFAHNAVVWGYLHRLYESGAEAAYAGLLAERMAWRSLVSPASVPVLGRVLAGLLHFLWGQHKIPHLESWMLRAHTNIVALAVQRHSRAPDDETPAALDTWVAEATELLDRVEAAGAGTPSFSGMRAALHAPASTPDPPAAEPDDEAVAALIDRCRAESPWTAADLAAWISGEVQHRVAAATSSDARRGAGLRYRSLFDSLVDHEEGRYMPYLVDGFADVRESGGQDLLARWSSRLL